ncbi:MAG: cyclodeaminase/cyclohydrolase family protein, partial [Terriglobales bacterium]
SAAAGAMAAALANMVAAMSRGKKAYLAHEAELSAAIATLAKLRESLKAAIDADAESYNQVMAAYKQAKAGASEGGDHDSVIESALKGATNVPLSVAEQSREVARMVEKLGPITNPKMVSDLTVAAALAQAAVTGALANVEINLASLRDEGFISATRKRAAGLR